MTGPDRIWATEDKENFGEDRFHSTFQMKGLTEYIRADLYAAQAEEIARLTAERDDAIRAKDCFQRMTRAHWEALCAMRNSINEYIPMPNTDSGPLFSPEDGPIYADIAERVIADLAESRAYALALEQELRDRARLTAERDAALAGAVKVKPLVWVDFHDRGAKAHAWNEANYMIQKWSDGRWEISASYPGYSTSIYGTDRFYPTIEAAKAAAQADYDARILAAIQPDPEAHQAALAKAWMMGREDAAGAAKHAGLAFGYERAVQAIRALTPPADLAAKIGGE